MSMCNRPPHFGTLRPYISTGESLRLRHSYDRHETMRSTNQRGELRTQPCPDAYLSTRLPNSAVMTTSRCSRYCTFYRLNIGRVTYSGANSDIYQGN